MPGGIVRGRVPHGSGLRLRDGRQDIEDQCKAVRGFVDDRPEPNRQHDSHDKTIIIRPQFGADLEFRLNMPNHELHRPTKFTKNTSHNKSAKSSEPNSIKSKKDICLSTRSQDSRSKPKEDKSGRITISHRSNRNPRRKSNTFKMGCCPRPRVVISIWMWF